MIGSIVGAVLPPLVGGLLRKKESSGGSARSSRWDAIDRDRYVRDRANEREYAERLTRDERNYVRLEKDRDRRAERNEWNRQHTIARRDQRADWNQHQRDADFRAEKSAESRGYDLVKLREQATAAGFNPLTLMQAGLGQYSTEVNYQAVGPGAQAGSTGSGVSGFAGGSSYSGSGYVSAGTPAMARGSFIGDAVERGLDTFYNTPPASDPLADALRAAISYGDTIADAQAMQVPKQGFGYDLTKQEPFKARVSVNMPPTRMSEVRRSANADPGRGPADKGVWVRGERFKGDPGWSDAADVEDRNGGIVGEIYGVGRTMADFAHLAREGVKKNWPKLEKNVAKFDGKKSVDWGEKPDYIPEWLNW